MLIVFFGVSLKGRNKGVDNLLPREMISSEDLSILCDSESFVVIILQPLDLLNQVRKIILYWDVVEVWDDVCVKPLFHISLYQQENTPREHDPWDSLPSTGVTVH